MNSLMDIFKSKTPEEEAAFLKKFTQPTFTKIVELFHSHLNRERLVQRELNFKKYWAQQNHLSKEEAVKGFKKLRGKDGYLRELGYPFIAQQCKAAGLHSEQDLFFLEKEGRARGFARLFPWPR